MFSNSDFVIPPVILMPLSSSLRAGGLFHYKKDNSAYSIAAGEYMPLFVSAAAAPGAAAAAAAAGGGTGTPNRRAEAPVDRVSDGEEGGDLISPDHNRTSPILELETMGAGGSGGAWGTRHPRLQDFSLLLSGSSSAKLDFARGYTHIEIFHHSISETG